MVQSPPLQNQICFLYRTLCQIGTDFSLCIMHMIPEATQMCAIKKLMHHQIKLQTDNQMLHIEPILHRKQRNHMQEQHVSPQQFEIHVMVQGEFSLTTEQEINRILLHTQKSMFSLFPFRLSVDVDRQSSHPGSSHKMQSSAKWSDENPSHGIY